MDLSIIILIVAIILFGVIAFKQVSALILAPLVSIFVILCFRMPVLDTLLNAFMPAASNYVSQYFLVFFVGALFGAVYQFTGAAESVARTIGKVSHGKFVAPIIMCITGLLTFGGITGFVVFFVVYPIAVQMYKDADLSRITLPAAISAGCWTWSMTAPGSPSIQNVIAMRNLGTSASAAFVPSLIASIVEFALIFVWLEMRARKLRKKGRFFYDSTLTYQLTPEELSQGEGKDLPSFIVAILPIAVILIAFNIFDIPVETSVFLGVVLATILMFKRIEGGVKEWIKVFNKGAADSGVAILNTAIVVGFGGVVQNTEGFTNLVNMVKNMNISPLVFVAIAVAICAGACGSASGGMGVAFNALKDTFIGMGVAPEYIHRVGAIAAGTLDTLPHQGAQITLLGICKMTHKEAYFDIAITQILIPVITLCVFIPLAQMGL
ncbi:MAG: GntP family permease [Clostridia bacterium]|nr:GntP family permease [Clostridia bacterium]